jgi:hypothetical protein
MEVPTPRFPICVDLLGGGNCYEIGGLRAMGTLTQVLKLNDFKPSQSQPAQVSTACRSIKPYTYISPMISNLSATRLKKKSELLHPLTTVAISPILALREQRPIMGSEVTNSKHYDS